MRSRWLAELANHLLALLPSAATATAEGAWVAVVYAAVAVAVANGVPTLDLLAFVLAAAIGMAVGRRLRVGRLRSLAYAAVTIAAAVGGLAATSDLPGQVVSGASTTSGLHADAGLLLGLAAWRGTRHDDAKSDDISVAELLRWGVPGLAVPWIVGSALHPGASFVTLALPATLLFVASGLVAIGLTRLDALARETGIDWRTNRTWLAMLFGVVATIAAVGLPIAFLLGVPLDGLLATLAGPVSVLIRLVAGVLGVVAEPLREASTHVGLPIAPPQLSVPGLPQVGIPSWVAGLAAIGASIALVGGLLALARRVRGTPKAPPWELPHGEERRIALPSLSIRMPALSLPHVSIRRPAPPKTASEAYLALLGELALKPDLARRSTETAARHSRRLRNTGVSDLSLDLLAADFSLERYASRPLRAREVARAIDRWRRLRAGLGAASRPEHR